MYQCSRVEWEGTVNAVPDVKGLPVQSRSEEITEGGVKTDLAQSVPEGISA